MKPHTLLFLRALVSLTLSIKRKNHVTMRYPWKCNFGEKQLQVYLSGCFKTPGIDEKDLEDTNQEVPMGLRNNLGLIPVVVRYIAFLSCSLGMYLFKVGFNRKIFDETFGEFFVRKIFKWFRKNKISWYRERLEGTRKWTATNWQERGEQMAIMNVKSTLFWSHLKNRKTVYWYLRIRDPERLIELREEQNSTWWGPMANSGVQARAGSILINITNCPAESKR